MCLDCLGVGAGMSQHHHLHLLNEGSLFKDDSVGDDFSKCGRAVVKGFYSAWPFGPRPASAAKQAPFFYAKGFQAILLSAHVGRSVTVLLSGGKLLIAPLAY